MKTHTKKQKKMKFGSDLVAIHGDLYDRGMDGLRDLIDSGQDGILATLKATVSPLCVALLLIGEEGRQCVAEAARAGAKISDMALEIAIAVTPVNAR